MLTKEEKEWGEIGTVSLGMCWQIINEKGVRYEPINMDEELRSEGLEVKFEFKVRNDMASVCMQGQIIELTRIEKR